MQPIFVTNAVGLLFFLQGGVKFSQGNAKGIALIEVYPKNFNAIPEIVQWVCSFRLSKYSLPIPSLKYQIHIKYQVHQRHPKCGIHPLKYQFSGLKMTLAYTNDKYQVCLKTFAFFAILISSLFYQFN